MLAADPVVPGRWFALSNLGVFAREPRDAAWTRLAAPDGWQGLNPLNLAVCDR